MEVEYSIYLGAEQKNGFTGFLSEKNFFCIVEIFDGFSSEQGEQLMSALAEVGTTSYHTLSAFDSRVLEILKAHNVPLDTSLAVGYKKNQTLYLKTVGTGEIYLGRNKAFERIIQGPLNAAGEYQENDFYVFTTSFFTQSLKGVAHTKHLLHNKTTIRDFPEEIKQTVGAEDDTGAVALFVRMIQQQRAYTSSPSSTTIRARLTQYFAAHKKLILGGVLALCIGVLGWNIVQGIQNRGGFQMGKGTQDNEKIKHIELLVAQAKEKTDEVESGLKLLSEAKDIANSFSKTASQNTKEELSMVNKKIIDTESLLIKKTEKTPQEYYDFGIEEKNAKGTKISLFEERAYILNPDGKVYILMLGKKSLSTVALAKKVSADSLVAGYEDNTYVLEPLNGITKIDKTGKGKIVIPTETQWSSIVGMQVFNGNIYLLDGGNSALYKYPVTTDAYGDRVSYFKGSYDDMDLSSSFAIDMSVYVATGATVAKYTAGIKDDFKLTLPGSAASITKVIAHTDDEKLSLWDKKNKVIYISDKEGKYERQVGAQLIGEASDIEVYKGTAFLLKGAKLYAIEL